MNANLVHQNAIIKLDRALTSIFRKNIFLIIKSYWKNQKIALEIGDDNNDDIFNANKIESPQDISLNQSLHAIINPIRNTLKTSIINNNQKDNLDNRDKSNINENTRQENDEPRGQIFEQKSKTENQMPHTNQESDDQPIKRHLNLRIGDIVYFKFQSKIAPKKNQQDNSNRGQQGGVYQGILSGDGIANNKLVCESNQQNEAQHQFQKCLFRIETTKQFKYRKQYNQWVEQKDKFKESKEKYEKEKFIRQTKLDEENEDNLTTEQSTLGQPVYYGQSIQLKHCYSKCIIRVNPQKIARQNGCVELQLDEEINEFSNFRILPSDNLQKQGDVVSYTDLIQFAGTYDSSFFIHVADDNQQLQGKLNVNLEVNSSEISSVFKLYCYQNIDQVIAESKIKDQCIQNGEIVKIYNKSQGGYLTINERNFKNMLELSTQSREDKTFDENLQNVNLYKIKYKKNQQYTIKIDDNPNSYYSLWYFQKNNGFEAGLPCVREGFRLRNVMTNMFLAINREKPNELHLTANGSDEECLFFLKPKKLFDIEDRITYEDLFKILTVNKSTLYTTEKNTVMCDISKGLSSNSIFKFEQIDSLSEYTANRMASLYPQLHEFYIFLHNWGLLSNHNEELHEYSFDKACQTERELEMEVDQLLESIENLGNFMNDRLNNELPLIQKQNLLSHQKIFELLIKLSQLIHYKLYPNSIQQDKSRMLMQSQFRTGVIDNKEDKTPEAIASKYLMKPIKAIWKIIFKIIRDNSLTSSYLLSYERYLRQQLSIYKNEIGKILIEAVRSSNNLSDENDFTGEDIIEWINLIEMITEDNIDDQCLYLKFLSNACFDIENKDTIRKYQVKCNNMLLKENAQKGCTFLYHNSSCYISFQKTISFTEFVNLNPALASVQTISLAGNNYYKIEEFQGKPNLKLYVNYISYYLMLLGSVCRGRFKDAIDNVLNLGINYEYVIQGLKNQNIPYKIKIGLIDLYSVLFLDIKPLQSITSLINRCYIWNEIDKQFDFTSGFAYKWMLLSSQQDIDTQDLEHLKKLVEDLDKFLNDFWEKGDRNTQLILNGLFVSTPKSNLQINERDQKQLNAAKEYILSMLQLTRCALSFGLTNFKMNEEIISIVSNIFRIHVIDQQAYEEQVENQVKEKNWIIQVLKQTQNDNEGISVRILEECLEILYVFQEIRKNLQILTFLKYFKEQQQQVQLLSSNNKNKDNNIEYFFNQLMNIYDLNAVKVLKNKKNQKDKIAYFMDNLLKSITTKDEGLPLDQYILDILRNCSMTETFLTKRMLEILVSLFTQRQRFFDDLRNVELIVDGKELDIYYEFMGGDNKDQSISSLQLQLLVESILEEIERQKYSKLDRVRSTIQAVNKIINIINIKFDSRYSDKAIFAKTQNIVRNIHLHKYILKLLKFNQKEKDRDQEILLKAIIEFLTYFSYKNHKNQRELEPFLNDLLNLAQKNFKISKLIISIVSPYKYDSKSYEIIDILFNNISKVDTMAQVPIKIDYIARNILRESLSILRSFLVGQNEHCINAPLQKNQKRVITKLIKDQKILNFLELRLATDLKQKTIDLSNDKNGTHSEDFQNFLIQQDLILLLSYVAKESKTGIGHVKRFVFHDQIKELLFSQNTPFLIKKPYLRLYFELFIKKIDNMNKNFSQSDMVEFLEIVILQDLKAFMKYIEGIVDIVNCDQDKKKQNLAIRGSLMNKKTNYKNYEKSTGKLAIMQSSVLTDTKKTLFDPKEYWDYLYSGNSWDLTLDGLLCFLLDCLGEISDRKWLKGDNFERDVSEADVQINNSLSQLKVELIKIFETISEIEKDNQLDFLHLKLIIRDCLIKFPPIEVTRIGKNIQIIAGKEYTQINNSEIKTDKKQQIIEQNEQLEKKLNDILGFYNNIKPVNQLIMKLNAYLLRNKMNQDEIYDLFQQNNYMNTLDFKNQLISYIGRDNWNEDEFYSLIDKINKKTGKVVSDTTKLIYLNDFYKIFYKVIQRYSQGQQESQKKQELRQQALGDSGVFDNNNNSGMINLYYTIHLGEFFTHCLVNQKQRDYEILEFVDVLIPMFQQYNGPNAEKTVKSSRSPEYLKEYLKELQFVFKRKENNIYLLKILKNILDFYSPKNQQDEEEENLEKIIQNQEKLYSQIQKIFNSTGVTQLCASLIKKDNDTEVINESVQLLILLLKNADREIQENLLKYLKSNNNSVEFFSYIKQEFRTEIERNKEERTLEVKSTRLQQQQKILLMPLKSLIQEEEEENNSSSRKLVLDFLKVLQMSCDNVFTEFQDFLRSQVSETNTQIVSTNIINEVSVFTVYTIDYLTEQSNRQKEKEEKMSKYILDLPTQCFATLAEFCMGPSLENQNTLGKQKRLIMCINKIIKINLDYDPYTSQFKEQELEELTYDAVKFLLALVNGNTNSETKRSIMENLNLKDLVNLMVSISKKKIDRKTKMIVQEKYCLHNNADVKPNQKNCTPLQCKYGYLTLHDRILIDTAFNIYILFTILRDEFAEDQALKIISYKPIDSNQYRSLEKKYKEKKKQEELEQQEDKYNSPSKSGTKIVPQRGGLTNVIKDDDSSETYLLKDTKQQDINDGIFNFDNESGGIIKEIMKNKIREEIIEESEQTEDFLSLQFQKSLNTSLNFFENFVGSVEIMKDDEIQKTYFQSPFVSKFITEDVKYDLIWEANRNSDQERIEFFISHIDMYLKIMSHRQRLSRYLLLDIFVTNWRFLKDISTILIIVINVILLLVINKDNIGDIRSQDNWTTDLFLAISILQVIILVICMVCCMAERYPISISRRNQKALAERKNIKKKRKGFQVLQVLNSVLDQNVLLNQNLAKTSSQIVDLLIDFDNLYNICYLALTILAWLISPTIYSILLLDLVKRSQDLQNVIRAVTSNIGQLIKTAILGITVMYLYSIVAVFAFSDYYQEGGDNGNLYCQTLLECWTSTMNQGLRMGGGIGDALESPKIDDPNYWGRYAFDLTFFILVNIIMLNIIFGIIIDKFGDLRDKRKETQEKVAGTCYICGLNKYEFEAKGSGWNKHIDYEHNVYDYLNFIIYINKKETTDCNGIEKYVKERIKKSNTDFIPIGKAMCLLGGD